MQGITKEVNASYLALKKAEIGTKEWVAANEKLEKAKQLQSDMKTQIEATNKASATLKQTFGGVLNQIPGFSALSGAFNSLKGGVGGLTSGFGLLRGAIIATGIGALIIAVTALVSWFSKTEKGANIIAGAFKGMGAVIDTLMGKLWNIGNTLKELFSNPIEFFKNLGNDIANAAKEGYDFVQVMDDIEDRQRDMEVTAKQNDILVDQLLLQAKNVGKTYEEKIALLNKANDLTRKTYKDQLALSKEYLDAVEKEVASEMKRQGVKDMTDEQADKIKNAKLAYLDLLGQEISTEEKIANRREQILTKQEKAQDRKDEKDLAAREKKEKQDADADEKQKAKDEKEAERDLKKKEDAIKREADYRKQLNAESEKWANEQIRIEQERFDFEEGLRQAEKSAMQASYHLLADLLAKQMGDEKAAKVVKKSAAIADIGIALFKERAYNAVAAAQYAATFPPPAGVIAGAAYLFRANTVSAIRAGIATARVLAFEKGGWTGRGANDEAAGIVHKNEYVVPAHITQNPAYGGILGALENARLRGYQPGGMVSAPSNPFSSSRSVTTAGTSVDAALQSASIDYDKLANIVLMAMDQKITTLRVVNNLQETEKGLATLNQLRNEADV